MPHVEFHDAPPEDADAPGTDKSTGDHSSNGQGSKPDFAYLFKQRDLSSFVKIPKTATAREYEAKTAAVLKAGLIGALNTGNVADAATLIYHGPGFAAATGTLADADDNAKRVLDFITAPANPYVMFALTALPMFAQLWRNHESQLAEVPATLRNRAERKAKRKAEAEGKPRVTIGLPFGKSITLGVRARFPLGRFFTAFRAQTADPNEIAVKVFSDPKVLDQLRRQGVEFRDASGSKV